MYIWKNNRENLNFIIFWRFHVTDYVFLSSPNLKFVLCQWILLTCGHTNTIPMWAAYQNEGPFPNLMQLPWF